MCYQAFKETALNLTNKYRFLHHANPLIQANEAVTSLSQAWANNIVGNFQYEHNLNDKGNFGENLFLYMDSRKFSFDSRFECQSTVFYSQ
jgi:hypothetical protein